MDGGVTTCPQSLWQRWKTALFKDIMPCATGIEKYISACCTNPCDHITTVACSQGTHSVTMTKNIHAWSVNGVIHTWSVNGVMEMAG